MDTNLKHYIGTKHVLAMPMNKGMAKVAKLIREDILEPNEYKKPGYKVVYPDGYESWSPKEVFDSCYRIAETPLDRLYQEINELVTRFNKLDAFMKTDEFLALPSDIIGLLEIQYGAMMAYNHALQLRAVKMRKSLEADDYAL